MCAAAGGGGCAGLEGAKALFRNAIRVSNPKTPMNSRPWALSQRLITLGFYLCTPSHGSWRDWQDVTRALIARWMVLSAAIISQTVSQSGAPSGYPVLDDSGGR